MRILRLILLRTLLPRILLLRMFLLRMLLRRTRLLSMLWLCMLIISSLCLAWSSFPCSYFAFSCFASNMDARDYARSLLPMLHICMLLLRIPLPCMLKEGSELRNLRYFIYPNGQKALHRYMRFTGVAGWPRIGSLSRHHPSRKFVAFFTHSQAHAFVVL